MALVAGFCTFDAIATGMWFGPSYQRPLEEAALISYGIVLLLLAPAPVVGRRISPQRGDYAFEKRYSSVWEALSFVVSWLCYRFLATRRCVVVRPTQGEGK